MSDALLNIKNLSAGVEGKAILKNLNLTINKGEVHVILGPNGSGKSTLMNVIMGHPKYEVTAGDIFFEGRSLLEKIPGITVENMLRTAKQAVTGEKVKIMAFKKELKKTMEELKIDPSYAERYMNVGFSGGEKKRNEILQLLMLAPKLALLDETDSGLDVDAVQIVSSGIEKYHTADNSCLIITHNSKILEKLKVDRVHVIIGGRVVEEGGPELIDEVNRRGFTHILDDAAAK